ncbi:hypothetical protein K413DRAFT_4605 [Clostridium sp. ASBs410]|nr:hypothetical protein K413DRAFT_4605 [Clostridium sp. ASBs410]
MNKYSVDNTVKATRFGEEFGLTEGMEYKILDYCSNMILVRNNSEDEEWYTIEYFY